MGASSIVHGGAYGAQNNEEDVNLRLEVHIYSRTEIREEM